MQITQHLIRFGMATPQKKTGSPSGRKPSSSPSVGSEDEFWADFASLKGHQSNLPVRKQTTRKASSSPSLNDFFVASDSADESTSPQLKGKQRAKTPSPSPSPEPGDISKIGAAFFEKDVLDLPLPTDKVSWVADRHKRPRRVVEKVWERSGRSMQHSGKGKGAASGSSVTTGASTSTKRKLSGDQTVSLADLELKRTRTDENPERGRDIDRSTELAAHRARSLSTNRFKLHHTPINPKTGKLTGTNSRKWTLKAKDAQGQDTLPNTADYRRYFNDGDANLFHAVTTSKEGRFNAPALSGIHAAVNKIGLTDLWTERTHREPGAASQKKYYSAASAPSAQSLS
jgi:hypothetical protein